MFNIGQPVRIQDKDGDFKIGVYDSFLEKQKTWAHCVLVCHDEGLNMVFVTDGEDEAKIDALTMNNGKLFKGKYFRNTFNGEMMNEAEAAIEDSPLQQGIVKFIKETEKKYDQGKIK